LFNIVGDGAFNVRRQHNSKYLYIGIDHDNDVYRLGEIIGRSDRFFIRSPDRRAGSTKLPFIDLGARWDKNIYLHSTADPY